MANAGPLQRLEQGTAPRGLRLAIAEGMIPLDGRDLQKALTILCSDPDEGVTAALRENFPTLPHAFLNQMIRDSGADPILLDFAARNLDDDELLTSVLLNRNVADESLVYIAQTASSSIASLLSENRHRMASCPEILDRLLENPNLPQVNRFQLLEFRDAWMESMTQEQAGRMDRPKAAVDSPEKTTDSHRKPDDDLPPDMTDFDALSDTPEPEDDLLDFDLDDDFDALAEDPDQDLSEEDIEETPVSKASASHEAPSSENPYDGWEMDDLTHVEGLDEENDDTEDEFGFEGLDIKFEEEESGTQSESAEDDGWSDLDIDNEFSNDDEEDDDLDEEGEEEAIQDTRIRMLKMNAAEKLLLAKMGTKQERAILVRDPNKQVAVAVVESPKMSEFEILLIAQNRSVCEEVLRAINMSREWGKVPLIRKALVLNPKTPMSISLRLINSMNDMDLKDVMKSKEIPYGLTAAAKRLFDLREARRSRR